MRTANTRLQFILLSLLAGLVACRAQDPQRTPRNVASETNGYAAARARMVEDQIRHRGITDSAVLAAMSRVPRHLFVPAIVRHDAYADHPLPIGHDQTISQPYIVAYMTDAADVGPSDRVLEIGTGSGYQAAILAEIAREVYSIEIVPELAVTAKDVLTTLGYRNLQLKTGDGYAGWNEHAPFDAIVVTAAPDHLPPALVEQLAVNGRLVIPVGNQEQQMRVITKTPQGVVEERTLGVRFVPLVRSRP